MASEQKQGTILYVILNTDLDWPCGAMIVQGCHAVMSLQAKYHDHPMMIEYLSDLPNMTKRSLGISQNKLEAFMKKLDDKNIIYSAWTEMPENVISAIALLPCYRNDPKVKSAISGLKNYASPAPPHPKK